MRNKLIFSCVILSLLAISCTSPTQRLAAYSMKRGIEQESSIVLDLSTLAKQQAVDHGVASVKLALAKQDEAAAKAAVENTANTFNKIGWLQIQHERALSLLRTGQMYIWSQEGIIDILIKEGGEAKKKSDAKKTAN